MFNYFLSGNFSCISSISEGSTRSANNEKTRPLKRASDHIINIFGAIELILYRISKFSSFWYSR